MAHGSKTCINRRPHQLFKQLQWLYFGVFAISFSSASAQATFPPDIKPQQVLLPYVPPVTAPELFELDSVGEEIKSKTSIFEQTGLDILAATCDTAEGNIEYREESGGFLSYDPDNISELSSNTKGQSVDIRVNPDGSGFYESAGTRLVRIEVNADGSGTYYRSNKGSDAGLTVDANGAGRYEESGTVVKEVVINHDRSGSFYLLRPGDDNGIIEITVNTDGSGEFFQSSGRNVVEYSVNRSGEIRYYREISDPPNITELFINVDGSGSYEDTAGKIRIDVDSSGSGTYRLNGNSSDFSTETGILDKRLLTVNDFPEFHVADRFPKLDTLPALKPICATVIRLNAALLFNFDSDELRADAAIVLNDVATALGDLKKRLEVHGHTDSKGDDEYNLALSERRASAVKKALIERNDQLQITTIGFGENRAIAPNITATGEDNPAGRQLNRRVEIVLLN